MTYENYMSLLKENVLDALEKGINPWQAPWDVARNGFSNNCYKGINNILLSLVSNRCFDNETRWYTFEQAKELGCSVKKGEKATPVFFFRSSYVRNKRDENNNLILDENGNPEKEIIQTRPVFCVHSLFNAQQLDPVPELKTAQYDENLNQEYAEKVLSECPVQINYDQVAQAYYSLDDDTISMPPKTSFSTHGIESFYSTAFHEMAHSTGSFSRLNRDDFEASFGSSEYAREELVAEISALSLCEKCGIKYTNQNSASYIVHWATMIKDPDFHFSQLYGDVSKAVRFLEHPEDRANLILQAWEKDDHLILQAGSNKYINIKRGKNDDLTYFHCDIYLSHLNGFDIVESHKTVGDSYQETIEFLKANTDIDYNHLKRISPLEFEKAKVSEIKGDYLTIRVGEKEYRDSKANGTCLISTDNKEEMLRIFYPYPGDAMAVVYGVSDGKITFTDTIEGFSAVDILRQEGYNPAEYKTVENGVFFNTLGKATTLQSVEKNSSDLGNVVGKDADNDLSLSPVVRFVSSDHPYLNKERSYSLLTASKTLDFWNSKAGNKKYKTDFVITFIDNGIQRKYSGRYEISQHNISLLDHIARDAKEFLDSKKIQDSFIQQNKMREFRELLNSKNYILEKLIPYFNGHQYLDNLYDTTQEILKTFESKDFQSIVDKEFIAYSKARLAYIRDSRISLNEGRGFDALHEPKLDDFQYAMPDDAERIKRVYISGPITADPDYVSSFKKAEIKLQEWGYETINPVELVKGKLSENASAAETWRQAMELDLEALRTSDAVVFIDKKGLVSNGMDIELYTAKKNNIPIISIDHVISYNKKAAFERNHIFTEKSAEVERYLSSATDARFIFKEKNIFSSLTKDKRAIKRIAIATSAAARDGDTDKAMVNAAFSELAFSKTKNIGQEPMLHIVEPPAKKLGIAKNGVYPLSEVDSLISTTKLDNSEKSTMVFAITIPSDNGLISIHNCQYDLSKNDGITECVNTHIDRLLSCRNTQSEIENAYWESAKKACNSLLQNANKSFLQQSLGGV